MSSNQGSDFNPEFEALLNYIKRRRGFDFSGYKLASLTRRIQKRMQSLNVDSYTHYVDYLEVHPEEFGSLFDTILINVTNFFRDPSSWEYVATAIIPQIIASKPSSDPIRVWSAGCASGEEAYTAAILLAEALGIEQFRERVKVYASDADEDALANARQAAYTVRDIATVPPPLVEKYFDKNNQRYVFRKDLRRAVIFGRHNLIQDAPISRIDLLICRNVLMYFNAETQARILSRFHFALNDTGFLLLGKAEMLLTHANLFTPVDLKQRLFTSVPRVTMRDRLMMMAHSNGDDESPDQLTRLVRFRESVFESGQVAQIVVDQHGILSLVNERARLLLGLTAKDIGRSLQDLEFSYRLSGLASRIEEVYRERRSVILKDLDWINSTGDVHTLEIQISRLMDTTTKVLGVSITFTDVTRYKRLQQEVEHSNQELETAYEELQSTNEELETTNEELQSTVEELETTNEELQSTNEELETMNEELQSTNEELQTLNDELRRRTDELNLSNAFLESILTSMRGGVVVVDNDLRVQVWSQKAEDIWGLRANETRDKNFLNLDIGLPVAELRHAIRACMTAESAFLEVKMAATNRRGKPITCNVTCTPLYSVARRDVQGAILVMEAVEPTPTGVDG